MRYEEIIWLSRVLVSLGVNHVRFTGGEPFARLGVAEFLVEFRREFPDLAVSVTTNASLISKYIREIREARLCGLNISLDTLEPKKFSGLTRTGDISDVLAGIDAALDGGVPNIKTNTVLMRGFNDDELPRIMNFAWGRGIIPRIIEFMPLEDELWGRDKFIGSTEIFDIMKDFGDWAPLAGEVGYLYHHATGPAKYYVDVSNGRVFGIIEAVSNHFCAECNRLRITATGKMRACLFNNREMSLIDLIRSEDEEGVRLAILSGADLKPENWRECADGFGRMSGIGG
jgi:cyclic pyranopterin phosphate synthase